MNSFHETIGECNYLAGMGCPSCEHDIASDSKNWRCSRDEMIPEDVSFIDKISSRAYIAHYIIRGITCGGCVSQCEKSIRALSGVDTVSILFDSGECHITYNPNFIDHHQIEGAVGALGFELIGFDSFRQIKVMEDKEKKLLGQIGVSGIAMMPIMMASIGLYYGDELGMSSRVRESLSVLSLLVTTVVLVFSALPFFQGCYRAFKLKSVTMDVTISMAVLLAFGLSLYNLYLGQGDTYFESLVMLVFLILVSRFVELKVRQGNAKDLLRQFTKRKITVDREVKPEVYETIDVTKIHKGDRLLIKTGNLVPADGTSEADCVIDESAFTGESTPAFKQRGDRIFKGTYNIGEAFHLLADRVGSETRIHEIERLAEDCLKKKPKIVAKADLVASRFLLVVMSTCVIATIIWLQFNPTETPQVLLSILIAACPCALSIATPSAISQCVHILRRRGIVINHADVIERIPKINHVVFDKTGTLTQLSLNVNNIARIREVDDEEILLIAASLEVTINHPIAKALMEEFNGEHIEAVDVKYQPSRGVAGTIANKRYHLGSFDFVKDNIDDVSSVSEYDSGEAGYVIWLADEDGMLGRITLKETLAPGTKAMIKEISGGGIETTILSGDSQRKVRSLANTLGISNFEGEMSPESKLNKVQDLWKAGNNVAMLGDGNNDYPAQSQSFLSIALPRSPDISQVNADVLLLDHQLGKLPLMINIAESTDSVLKQGFRWSIGYNTIALILALAGMMTPLIAAIGMSASSIVVVCNTLRLQHLDRYGRL